ncbi:methyl-accepting chemotaxis protein [Rhabdochromatium marinum]|uniref:methyl-accepting chemotaxis protein n=1 Tax=Rhabdochromatium marinum TaxID=48729 RepID=UPI0019048DEC|nr:methyl-accepting chemotaxis protein [Rhabdochromatium marinum]MBK1648723.1 chemotaxis protein [Rhabdochromatium marinum]
MKFLRAISIKQRLWIQAGLMVTGLVVILLLALLQMRTMLMEEKIVQIRKLVENAQSVKQHFKEGFVSGELSLADAQEATLAMIKDLRYDDDNYFWVIDLSKKRVLMHPINPEFIGADSTKTQDSNGKRFSEEMLNRALTEDEGVVDYVWPKPGSNKPVPKILYFHRLADWNWLIATGIYVDDVNEKFWSSVKWFGVLAGGLLLIIAFISTMTGRSVVLPIRAAAHAMYNIAKGDGDLTQRLETDGRDEITDMAIGFNDFAVKTERAIASVGQATRQIATAAEELSAITNSSNESMDRQRNEIQQVVTAVTEMTATIQEVARNAEETATAATQADSNAHAGGKTVDSVVASNQKLTKEVEHIAETIRRFSKESVAIETVLDVIRGIAEQTNLLALNAAIEAARAGEQGRGFAVVADEVRSLAGRTQQSTTEIQGMIETLRNGAQEAVDAILVGEATTQETLAQTVQAKESLTQIVQSITRIRDMSTMVASAAEEQSTVAEEINRSVVRISDLAEESAGNSNQTAVASHELSHLGEDLHQLVGQFKVNAET